MSQYNIGPKIGIDGEAEFRRQIRSINSEYKNMDSYLKAVEQSMEKQGRSQSLLESKSAGLQQQIAIQGRKWEELNRVLEQVKAQFGEGSQEFLRISGAMLDVENTLNDLEQSLMDTDQELERLISGTGDLTDVVEDLGDSSRDVDRLTESLDDVGDSANGAQSQVVSFGDMLKAGLASGVFLSTLERVGEVIVDIGRQSIEAAADVKASNAQFEQTFAGLESQARAALNSVADATGIAATRLQNSYTSVYAFTKSVGGDQATALNIAQRALQAAADSAAYYDRTVEDATETLQSFLKGNYANDAALGIAATETTRNAKANELYAKSFKDLTEAQKVDTLLAMVEAGNKASGALGQAAREADSWTNVTGELSEAWRQLLASFGSPILEGLTPMLQGVTDVLKNLSAVDPWVSLNSGVEAFREGIAAADSTLADSNAKIDASASLAERYVQRLQELETQGLTTEDAMREYAATIDLINQLMPTLNLTVDETTGRLEQNTEQIYNNIEAYKRQAREQAKQAYYATIVEEMTAVQKDRYAAEMRLYELQQQQNILLEQGAQAVDLYAAAEAEAAGQGALFWASLSDQDRTLYEVMLEIQQTERALSAYDDELALHEQRLQTAIDATDQAGKSTQQLYDELKNAAGGMKVTAETTLADLVLRARQLGRDSGYGVAKGVRDAIPEVESAWVKLAKRGQGAYLHTYDQHSPSRLMRAKGKDSGLGAALGVEDAIPTFERAWTKFAEAGTSQYVQEQLDAAAAYPSIMAGTPGYGAGTTNNTRNVAYGGISININTQPGQDVNAIADAVIDRLTVELGQEEAAF